MPIRVLLVSDKDAGRQAIRQLLQTQPEIELVGEAADFPQALQMSNDLKPQGVIADLHMPDEARVSPIEVISAASSPGNSLLTLLVSLACADPGQSHFLERLQDLTHSQMPD